MTWPPTVDMDNYSAAQKAIYAALSSITAPPPGQVVTEVDFTWNGDGTVATIVYKNGSNTILTLTFTYNSGQLQSLVRS